MIGKQSLLVLGVLFIIRIVSAFSDLDVEETRTNICLDYGTELINEDNSLLFLSTLDGTFIGVNHRTGKIAWQFKEEAVVKVPGDTKNSLSPVFLPDPKDGSLYMFNSENHPDLKKLQFSIQQLVTSSPCRSTDGIFYTGKKIDNWFIVDWRTGDKKELLSLDSSEKICPVRSRYSMFLGRTEYNLIIQDITRKERKWNVTFYDYVAKVLPPDKIKNYEYLYFSGSSTGRFVVLKNSGDGSFLWEALFGSPIIGVYIKDGDGLISLPFTTMDDSSMHLLGLEFNKQIQLFSTLYIGKHTHGLYALPAIATIGSTLMLLNGPRLEDTVPIPFDKNEETTALLGYYKMPEYGIERLQIAGRSDAIIEMNRTNYFQNNTSFRKTLKTTAVQTDEEFTNKSQLELNRYIFHQLIHISIEYVLSSHNVELKIFMVTMIAMMICMFIYFRAQVREFKQSSSGGIVNMTNSTIGTVTAIAEELSDGSIQVGKILFNSNEMLGKGCEGTFVFKGQFDNRKVAVKRLLPECFTVADREVCLLRESDQHPNVIRYFCMEQDKQFRYIALELCSATLQDYTEKGILSEFISPTETLAQATAGLEHLHSLQIVHRDIKPHNVLLSFPSPKDNKVRVMISDFGLCKKLQTGKASFSRKSGITGTDGWIAPEMIHGKCRTTAAIDIFSMGCVFYYVLSKGKHPFGDSLSRQANIMNGDFNLSGIINDAYELWTHLIIKMVAVNPLERPSVRVIKNHPAFWNKDQILTFLQDVSDRIEKEETNSKILIELETGNSYVLQGDWRIMIEQEIADDLRRYRSYRADSVRDLLRALRNKKHHYRELSDAVKEILGSIPDKFVKYWMDKFPKLVLHTWLAMQCVNHEDVFQKYYCNIYTFPRIHDGTIPDWIQQSLNASSRWRYSNRAINQNNSFFSMCNGRTTEYNWRQRPKLVNDACEYNNNINYVKETKNKNIFKPLNILDETKITVNETDNLVSVDLINNYDRENLEPSEPNELEFMYLSKDHSMILNANDKSQKQTKYRHRKRPNRKKCTETYSEEPKINKN